MTGAIHVVVLHTNGHEIWLAPWLAYTLIAWVGVALFLYFLAWLLK
jgi:ABC-type multidrug transport system permease subunit